MFLSNASLKRPVAMTTAILALLVLGAFSYLRLGLDFLPKVDFPYVTVVTVYQGAGPREIETLVTEKIEDAVSSIDGVKHIRSTSMEDISQVFIEFEFGVDVDIAAIDVREKVDEIKADLPDDADPPKILKFDVNAAPIANLALYGDRPLNELWEFADDFLKDQLGRIQGVASVDIIGGKKREIRISVDQVRLAAYGLSVLHIVQRLDKENLDLPGGHITEQLAEYTIRTDGEFDTVDEIRKLELVTPSGDTIHLSDVADIQDTFEEQRRLARYKGQECVGLIVKKRADANTVQVVNRMVQELDHIRKGLPAGMKLDVASEESAFIRASVEDVQESMMIGIALTAIILYVFLHNLRLTTIVAMTMPVSVVSTFLLMYLAGFTLNVMSLMGLAISIGILVDNSIIVLENIYRHMSEGQTPLQAAADGTSQIATAVTGSTLTNVVVFVPIAFMSGIVGQFFFQFGLTVTFATFVSLLMSFTLTPILSSKFLRKSDETDRDRFTPIRLLFSVWDWGFETMRSGYRRALGAALNHRGFALFLALAIFISSFMVLPFIGTEFVTEADRAKATIFLEMPPGTPLERTSEALRVAETRVCALPEVKHTFTVLGKQEGLMGKSSEGVHLGQITVSLTDKWDRAKTDEQVMRDIRALLGSIPGATVLVQAPAAIGGAESPLQIEVTGIEFGKLQDLAGQVMTIAAGTPGAVDVDTTWRSGRPEVVARPDRMRIADSGLSVTEIAMVLRAYIEGLVASQYRVGNKEYDIRVKLCDTDRDDAAEVGDMKIPVADGKTIPLINVATIEERTGPTQILRKDKQRMIAITANLSGRPLGDVVHDIETRLQQMDFPPAYGYFFGGRAEVMGEAFTDLFMAMGLAVILTYLVLAALLESFVQPLTIMLTLPLALVGVFLSLYITGKTISIFSLMAMVMLVGIVVNAAILLIEFTTQLREQGRSRRDALLEACPIRMRPVMMTALSTVIGMIPLALALGWGGEMRAPMAIVSIGGLLVSTFLTLFVIPIVYTLFDDIASFFSKP
ncbi:MAG: efflux RND transporter permease subunit [Candidatus Eisenbacteria bacterium]|nr:efflux RND transporter permease subunit [Candidatus Eisenbacteria bacterium]